MADKTILVTRDPAIRLWLSAHGDVSPAAQEAVRMALLRAINGSGAPLHEFLGVPRSGLRWRLHCRDYFFRKAALLVPARYTTIAKIAGRMLEIAPKFISEAAPAWDRYGIPSTSTDFERLLFLAYQTNIPPPSGLRQWQKIISMQ